jgi:hypothetical protein
MKGGLSDRAKELAPDETLLDRRNEGWRGVIRNSVLSVVIATAVYGLLLWLLQGGTTLREVASFAAVFAVISVAMQPVIRRRQDYILTDRRLLVGPSQSVPLEAITQVQTGAYSVTVHRHDGAPLRIVNLAMPQRLAVLLNRTRATAADAEPSPS